MMRVLGDKVLVALPPLEHEREETTGYDYRTIDVKYGTGRIVLAQRADSYSEEAQTRGIVMQLGEKSDSVSFQAVMDLLNQQTDGTMDIASLAPAPFDVAVGDCVLFAPSSGNPFTHDGVNYLILAEDDILAVLEPQKADAA